MVVPFYEVQIDDRTVAIGHGADHLHQFIVRELVIAAQPISSQFHFVADSSKYYFLLFDEINTGANKDPAGPSLEGTIAPEPRQVPVEFYETFLEAIVGIIGIAGITQTEAVHPPGDMIVELLKGFVVAISSLLG